MALAASLSGDALQLIFAHVPLRPRLLVVARVCRHWHTHAYLSVTAIVRPYIYDGPFERHPNITEMHLGGAWGGVPESWSPQQRARILSADFQHAHPGVLTEAALPSLTSVHFAVDELLYESHLSVIKAATSLTHVAIDYTREFPSHTGGYWERLPPLPALRSLAVAKSHTLHFSAMWSQLTRLDIADTFHWGGKNFTSTFHRDSDCTAAQEFPALRRLSLSTWGQSPAAWLQALPSLTALGVYNGSVDVVHAMPAHLVGLVIGESHMLPNNVALCTSLRQLYFDVPLPAAIEPLISIATQIRSLLLKDSYQRAHLTSREHQKGKELVATHFTRLHTLTMVVNSGPDSLPVDAMWLRHWHLPHLRVLSVDCWSLSWVATALACFHSLGTLQVTGYTFLDNETDDTDVAAFKAQVRAADQRGMELLDLGKCRDIAQRVGFAALVLSLHWLTLVVNVI